ncbi:MAG: T9SS type A sorting domain-containing protein [Bacteroidales bacterium]|nr:T9SS type A sorting domain-containing protein [Bacteroidales bacterium]
MSERYEKGLNQRFFCRRNKNNKFLVDLFIPIRIPLSEYVDGINYDEIYWYNPTDVFISLLPDRIKHQLKDEKDWILNNTPTNLEAKTCTFFEACRSTLQLDNLKVFPNPAKNQATVEFSANEDLVGNITLTNMAGVQIREVVEETQINMGTNSFPVDLTGLPSGLFIISINTNKGFRTYRIIVSQ